MAATATRSAKTLLMLGIVWVGLYWWATPTVPGLVLASVSTGDHTSQAASPTPHPTKPADSARVPPDPLGTPARVPASEDGGHAGGRAATPSVLPSGPDAHTQPAAPPPQPARSYETYTVRQGDTLTRIARARYGSVRFAEMIYRANRDRLAGPDTLSLGQQLRLPTDAEAWTRAHAGDR